MLTCISNKPFHPRSLFFFSRQVGKYCIENVMLMFKTLGKQFAKLYFAIIFVIPFWCSRVCEECLRLFVLGTLSGQYWPYYCVLQLATPLLLTSRWHCKCQKLDWYVITKDLFCSWFFSTFSFVKQALFTSLCPFIRHNDCKVKYRSWCTRILKRIDVLTAISSVMVFWEITNL